MESTTLDSVSAEILAQAGTFGALAGGIILVAVGLSILFWGPQKLVSVFKRTAK
jgi:hypothetical protein